MEAADLGLSVGHVATGTGSDATPVVSGDTPDHPRWKIYLVALMAGVVASAVSSLAGEFSHDVFKPKQFTHVFLGSTSFGPSTESRNSAEFRNAVLAYATIGSTLGLMLGLAGGVIGRSTVRGAIAGLSALVLGGGAGALASLTLLPLYYRRLVPDPNDLLTPILIQSGIAAAIGAAGGIGFAIGMGRKRHAERTIAGACLGGFLGAILFLFADELFFSDSGSNVPIPGSPSSRIMIRIFVTLLAAVGAAWGSVGKSAIPAAGASPSHVA